MCPRQDLAIQIERLKQAGWGVIRSETGSGATRDKLATVLKFLRAGRAPLDPRRAEPVARAGGEIVNLGLSKSRQRGPSVQPTGGRPSSVANSP
jgi:hypothetical protein